MLAKYDAVNGQALRRMIGAGAELRTFYAARHGSLAEGGERALRRTLGQEPDFKKGYDSMVAYRDDVLPWWQLNEYAFDTFMIRTRGRS